MQLLASREYPVIDYQTMSEFLGHERLFRMPDGRLLLHMSSQEKRGLEERLLWLSLRDAISWLNETPEQFGSFWEEAKDPKLDRDYARRRSATVLTSCDAT
jgi:hypothetical protein